MRLGEWKCFLMGHINNDYAEYYSECPRCHKDYNDWIWTLRMHIKWKVFRLRLTARLPYTQQQAATLMRCGGSFWQVAVSL